MSKEVNKNKELRELFDWIYDSLFEYDIDCCNLQDKMEKLGLLVKVKIPEEKQKNYPAFSEYETDTLLFPWYSKEVTGE